MWAEWDVRKVWILTVESFPRNFSNYVANAACICGCICDSGSSIRSNGMHAAPHFSMFLANSASRNSILIKFLYPRPLCELGKLSFAIPETYEVIQSFQKSKLVQSAVIGYFSSVTDNIVTTYTIILWLVKRHYKSIADNVNDVLPCHIRNFIHHNTLIH